MDGRSDVLVYVVGIAAALSLGLGYVLQQRVAQTAAVSELLSVRLVVHLMKRPLWWMGIAAMVVGQVLGALALRMASVALVEPLLSTNLLFALVIASFLSEHRVHWTEISGAILLSAALGVFIAVGNPHASPNPSPNRVVIAIAVCAIVAVVVILVGVGRRLNLLRESILLATATGLLYGLQDAATRSTLVVQDHHGYSAVFASPWLYIVVGGAAVGIVLSQSAFKAARLDYSLPPISAAEPITGILLGVTLLGDVVSVTITGLTVEAACLLAMLVAVALIGRSPSLAGRHYHLLHRPGLSPAPGEPADSP